MAYYRLYSLDPLTSHIVDVIDFDADSDASALLQVKAESSGVPRELWSRDRKVKDIAPKAELAPYRGSSLSMLIAQSQPWRWNSLGGNCQLVHERGGFPCAV